MRRPALLTGGLAMVVWAVAAAMTLSMARASPRLTSMSVPFLVASTAPLLVAAGMLWSHRVRRPRGRTATVLWWLTFALIVASTPQIADLVTERLPRWTGATYQDGPTWSMSPVTGLITLALFSQLPTRQASRPAMTVAGLSALLAAFLSTSAPGLIGLNEGERSWSAIGWVVVVLLVGLGMAGGSVARPATTSPGTRRLPSHGQRVTIAVLLLGAGTAMGAAQLIRWHTCLGWSWFDGEDGCGTRQGDGYDFAFPYLSNLVPGAPLAHGVGLVLLALALALAARFGPAGARWGPVRTTVTRLLWFYMVAVLVMGAVVTLTPGLRFVEGSVWGPLLWLSMDPLVFVVLAVLAGFDRRGDGLGRSARRWNTPLTQLLAGLAATNNLAELVFWSGIHGSYDTPPGSGTLRALVLIAVGLRLLGGISPGRRRLTRVELGGRLGHEGGR
ncbi:hypothetical protein [Pseudonocardia acaciae]|uniref:hypothetical protein n=1 Tax=Pseudonocardia acaciae TaxID=551276 RepID=UPI00048FC851|nr:hypothetical protein [Pseudonocardia acaciae]